MGGNIVKIFLVILSSFISCSISSPTDAKVAFGLLNSICSRTIDPPFCLLSLNSDPNTATTNIDGLAVISIGLAKAKVVSTLRLIGRLRMSTIDPTMRQRLANCTTGYNSASRDLIRARKAIRSHSKGSAWLQVSSAMDEANDCADEFKVPPKDPLLAISNAQVQKLCDIALVITALMASSEKSFPGSGLD